MMRTAVIAVALASLLLAACSGGGANHVTGTATSSAAPVITSSPTSTPTEDLPATCPPNPRGMDVACATADWARATLANGHPDDVFTYLLPQDYVCSGGVPEYGDACDGAAKGEHRPAFHIAVHGSEGEMASESRMRILFEMWLGDARQWRLVNIGCPTEGSCFDFVVVFAREGQPQVLYLAFEEVGHNTPSPLPPGSAKLTGFGVSGDNADDLRNGRATMTSLGETTFVQYGGKP